MCVSNAEQVVVSLSSGCLRLGGLFYLRPLVSEIAEDFCAFSVACNFVGYLLFDELNTIF